MDAVQIVFWPVVSDGPAEPLDATGGSPVEKHLCSCSHIVSSCSGVLFNYISCAAEKINPLKTEACGKLVSF